MTLARRTVLTGLTAAALTTTGATAAQAGANDRPRHPRPRNLSVLQFNIWMGGQHVAGGQQGIVDTVAASAPDVVTLSETTPERVEQLVAGLRKYGLRYRDNHVNSDNAIITRHPIVDSAELPSWSKAVIDLGGVRVAVYSGHLEYQWYATYLPRGYGAGVPEPGETSAWGWDEIPSGPVTDLDLILRVNEASGRTANTRQMIKDAAAERAAGHLVVAAGDFNEPSHLDWVDATRDRFDHHGLTIPWQTTTALAHAGFRDTYRELHPNPVTHPGFTWPSDNPGADVDQLTWTPKADERDRIDYVFYRPDARLRLESSTIVGPSSSIVRSQRVEETGRDRFIEPTWVWPTDHKALLTRFRVRPR